MKQAHNSCFYFTNNTTAFISMTTSRCARTYFIYLVVLLVLTAHQHLPVHGTTGGKTFDDCARDNHCETKMTEVQQPAPQREPYALVPYTTDGILSEFYETNKTIKIPGISKEFLIKQNWQQNGVAGVVWEAATTLSAYMVNKYHLNGKNVLELGAGTGLVGMAAHELGASVTVTDLAKALPLLEQNMAINFPTAQYTAQPAVKELEWGKGLDAFRGHFYDYIFGADIIYLENTFDALVETLHYLATSDHAHNNTKVVLSAKLRYDRIQKFVLKLKKSFATVMKVHEDKSKNVVIYECF